MKIRSLVTSRFKKNQFVREEHCFLPINQNQKKKSSSERGNETRKFAPPSQNSMHVHVFRRPQITNVSAASSYYSIER